jgi:hypothetical protein
MERKSQAQAVGLFSVQEPIDFRWTYSGVRPDQRKRHFQLAAQVTPVSLI